MFFNSYFSYNFVKHRNIYLSYKLALMNIILNFKITFKLLVKVLCKFKISAQMLQYNFFFVYDIRCWITNNVRLKVKTQYCTSLILNFSCSTLWFWTFDSADTAFTSWCFTIFERFINHHSITFTLICGSFYNIPWNLKKLILIQKQREL